MIAHTNSKGTNTKCACQWKSFKWLTRKRNVTRFPYMHGLFKEMCIVRNVCCCPENQADYMCCWIVMLIDSTCTDSISSIHFMFTLKRHINLCECRLLFISRYHTFDDRWGKIEPNSSQTDTNGKSREVM